MTRGGWMAVWGGALAIGVGMAAAAPVWADQDQEVTLTIREHRFEPAEVRAKAGSPIRLKVTNADATPEEFESTSLNREKLVRGGGTITIRLPALKPGVYEFFGEFNPKTATGRLVIE